MKGQGKVRPLIHAHNVQTGHTYCSGQTRVPDEISSKTKQDE